MSAAVKKVLRNTPTVAAPVKGKGAPKAGKKPDAKSAKPEAKAAK
jgi:hypothetical protein